MRRLFDWYADAFLDRVEPETTWREIALACVALAIIGFGALLIELTGEGF